MQIASTVAMNVLARDDFIPRATPTPGVRAIARPCRFPAPHAIRIRNRRPLPLEGRDKGPPANALAPMTLLNSVLDLAFPRFVFYHVDDKRELHYKFSESI